MVTFNPDKCVSCGQCAAVCPTHHITMSESGPIIHDNRSCLMCMHCTAACRPRAISFGEIAPFEQYPFKPEDKLIKRIMSRRSIRHFKPENPDMEDITWALDIAQWAPSGKNRHATKWLVIHGKEKCDALYNFVVDICAETGRMPSLAAQRAKGNHDSVTCGCTTILMAVVPDGSNDGVLTETADTDAAIAMTTAEMLLNETGLGTCWGGYLTAFSNQLSELKEYLHISEGYHVACTLLCGYPDEHYFNVPWRPKAQIECL